MQLLAAAAGSEPAGGAAIGQIAIATGMATVVTVGLLVLCQGHRSGRVRLLGDAAGLASRLSGLPAWAALPAFVGGSSLFVALFGMYWDISLHIDKGRDEGPLANPSHYFILVGLFGIFAAGIMAIALPKGDERPGPRSVRLASDWHAPVGGFLIAACGAFALTGFPLDDVWHRLFGQDVTLWGPTHLMLIGGAGMTLIGLAVLLGEATRGRQQTAALSPAVRAVNYGRRVGLMGGLLIGLSTFQAEFDFGVPQFRMVFQPLLIAFAAGFALVAARMWLGRGGALAAVAFFLLVRGIVSLLVGPVLGEITPSMPLYVAEALVVEVAALALLRRPLLFAAVSGVGVGTVGLAAEYAWTQVGMRIPWTPAVLGEAIPSAIVAGLAGATFGVLLALGLQGELARVRRAGTLAFVSLLGIGACVANGLVADNATGARAAVDVTDGGATVRITPDIAKDAEWATITAWQGRAPLHVDDLEPTGTPGVYRADEPVPTTGSWKAMVRVQHGRAIVSTPVFLPEDKGIPAPEVSVPKGGETRAFVADKQVLQREQKDGVPTWLTTVGPLVVLLIALGFAGALMWGVARIGRPERDGGAPPARRSAPGRVTPAGA